MRINILNITWKKIIYFVIATFFVATIFRSCLHTDENVKIVEPILSNNEIIKDNYGEINNYQIVKVRIYSATPYYGAGKTLTLTVDGEKKEGRLKIDIKKDDPTHYKVEIIR
ncbi:hypothetical protein [Acinetobacter calcoaceticus]|uniref:hypothetical protein n=1 Tax=Acinetobacter calcoaceticus TaxID=471 RepID=UPI003AF50E65